MSATFDEFERELDVLERWYEWEQKRIVWRVESATEDLAILRSQYAEKRAKIMEDFKDACGSKAG